jgi:hypothetical protein
MREHSIVPGFQACSMASRRVRIGFSRQRLPWEEKGATEFLIARQTVVDRLVQGRSIRLHVCSPRIPEVLSTEVVECPACTCFVPRQVGSTIIPSDTVVRHTRKAAAEAN